MDLFSDAVRPSGSAVSLNTDILDNTAYVFNGDHNANNWVQVSDATKLSFFEHVDNQAFTISFWIRVTVGSSSSYIFSFEDGNRRYLTLYDRAGIRATFHYFRDTIGDLEVGEDAGYSTHVALSFYYDPNVFPLGLRDNEWHFIAISIDFPSIAMTIDGYVIRPTQGNYRNEQNAGTDLENDGTIYDMPARILVKDQVTLDEITGYIGGSDGRGIIYAFDGAMRQFLLTEYMETEQYNCLGSCAVTIFSDDSVSGFNTFYNPAKRSFEFSSSADPSEPVGDTEYTQFMGTLIFSDNGFLPPEEEGESWRVSVQVRGQIISYGIPSKFMRVPMQFLLYSKNI